MNPVVLVGHRHVCPLHGINEVESGSATYIFNGRAVARVGDRTTCGAVIESGAEHFLVEGAAVARKGDRTDHGGVLEEGDDGWMLD
ncbi:MULTISPECIES: PAAR domain-containing protein [Pseudomonas]|uniref:PAAR domain-containing protein n=1 Tax=Pseudomonas putida TaxID=303 RepID=A0A3M8TCN4_PSEPU|nr:MULTISPECIES: PAAR domain-containing protein [Pseudomonas]MCO6690242.1 PAAR domain-containing protein [Pseudomonas shirazica]KIC82738.1 hypothetical protein RR51_09395 [Pseudomonas sp. C5pp]MBA6109777.1 PAAR domain-containing protein [Pseudomonas asiatica]MCE0849912.1 PAAR domain-containing protein [Pseudomonas asiatica]RNF89666.1 hypothetical protein EFK07_11895 [Pseudomonas putida]